MDGDGPAWERMARDNLSDEEWHERNLNRNVSGVRSFRGILIGVVVCVCLWLVLMWAFFRWVA